MPPSMTIEVLNFIKKYFLYKVRIQECARQNLAKLLKVKESQIFL